MLPCCSALRISDSEGGFWASPGGLRGEPGELGRGEGGLLEKHTSASVVSLGNQSKGEKITIS